jgi:hypothetical protein
MKNSCNSDSKTGRVLKQTRLISRLPAKQPALQANFAFAYANAVFKQTLPKKYLLNGGKVKKKARFPGFSG